VLPHQGKERSKHLIYSNLQPNYCPIENFINFLSEKFKHVLTANVFYKNN